MKILKHITLALIFIITFETLAFSQVHDRSWRRIIYQSEDNWFTTEEAKSIAENVLLYQRAIGGWPKNTQMQKPLSLSEKEHLKKLKNTNEEATTDNGATTQELYFLSKMYKATEEDVYKQAFLRGVDYLLEAQYENGGWPQFYPLKEGYYTHITYNDNSMVNILKVLQDLKDDTGKYAVKLSEEKKAEVETAFKKGIACIVKTQYKQNGVLTAWCAQHDENTLEPAKARSYELPSLSGAESANIVLLLMSLENPSPEVINSINSAVKWFEKTKLIGIRIKREFDKETGKRNTILVKEDGSYPLWARFMELDDNTPFFCDRDGIKKATLAEIGEERRNGYAWYSGAPNEVLKRYPEWKAKYDAPKKKQAPKDPYNMVVAKDGTGDFTTIQEALYASKSFPYQRVIINVKNGVYTEKVHIYSWNTHVSLIGESKEGTIITFDDYFKKIDLGRNSTFHTSTLLVEGDDFIAKNLTVKNTAGAVGQAIALSVNANRCYFEKCAFIGNQDTVYTAGEGFKQYFKSCYIEGTTDFIFGEATVLFEDCEIYNKSNSYITAASTPQNQDYGYVFKNCNLTAGKDVIEVYLGRPWRFYAKTVFIECDMGAHIRPEGWHNWKKAEAEKFSFYAEYNCSGEGFQPESRVEWSHQLKKSQAKKYTKENILKSTTKWYQNL
ncbi:pectate lyase [Aestuariibaculum sp. YM273]|uniref:pectate lyase n=1 Tax=Aestuariibaculum sp. YM273 TaxID=3070659 RepID=UPI0027DAF2D6|nr:pectate lyase [Aestuariibaculum sp. YM273]WMI66242.1 pectate lyase [Aestuariibaculum sp. YM273]